MEMDEFVENFKEFKKWLYERAGKTESYEENEAICDVIDKFEFLNLNDMF